MGAKSLLSPVVQLKHSVRLGGRLPSPKRSLALPRGFGRCCPEADRHGGIQDRPHRVVRRHWQVVEATDKTRPLPTFVVGAPGNRTLNGQSGLFN